MYQAAPPETGIPLINASIFFIDLPSIDWILAWRWTGYLKGLNMLGDKI